MKMVVFYKVVRGIGSGERMRIRWGGPDPPPTVSLIKKNKMKQETKNVGIKGDLT